MTEDLEYRRVLDENNRRKLRDLLGEEWDSNQEIDVEDLVGYFSPDRLMTELDILERKLEYFKTRIPGDQRGTLVEPKVNPEVIKDLRKAFIEHLRYLTLNFKADKRATT